MTKAILNWNGKVEISNDKALRIRNFGALVLGELELEHKTFALAINCDYFSTVFISDHPCTI